MCLEVMTASENANQDMVEYPRFIEACCCTGPNPLERFNSLQKPYAFEKEVLIRRLAIKIEWIGVPKGQNEIL